MRFEVLVGSINFSKLNKREKFIGTDEKIIIFEE